MGCIRGNEAIAITRASEDPIKVNITASKPFPSNNNLCPGRIDRDIEGSGAPKNIEGIESRKVFVIDIESIIITILVGDK